jgi:hypothetical protein
MGQKIQLLQDLVGVVVLAPAALTRLQTTGTSLVLGVAELAAIVFAVGAAAVELKSHRESNARVDWTNLFVGLVMMVEYVYSLEAGRKWFSPLFLTAIAMLVLAFARPLMQTRMRRRSVLRVDDEGFGLRLGPFRKLDLKWTEVAGMEDAGKKLRFALADGSSRTLSLRGFDNRDELRAALIAKAKEKALPVSAVLNP